MGKKFSPADAFAAFFVAACIALTVYSFRLSPPQRGVAARAADYDESAEMPAPVRLWDFRFGMDELNGQPYAVHGDTHIEEVLNPAVGRALVLDGDGDYISCGNAMNLGDEYAFATMINCQDLSRDYSAFFAKYETNYAGPYAFSVREGYVNCWITSSDGSHIEVESQTRLEENRWYHVCIVKKGDLYSLYLNGEWENEGRISSVVQSSDLVTIGRQALFFADRLQFHGYIGSIAIYDKALSESQVAQLAYDAMNA